MAHLDEEIVAVHFEIVELQRSPFARRQVDVMEQLSVSLELIILLQCYYNYNVIACTETEQSVLFFLLH